LTIIRDACQSACTYREREEETKRERDKETGRDIGRKGEREETKRERGRAIQDERRVFHI
jgi:hypothetical protein